MTDPATALADVRADPGRRYPVMFAGVLLGLVVALFHWTGLVLGGAVVGLAATDLKHALGGGVAFGLIAWTAFAAWLSLDGVLAGAIATGQLVALSAAIAVGCSVLGSLVRGIV